MNNLSAVILAGGKSKRMAGNDKAKLMFDGETFFDRIKNSLSDFGEVKISVDQSIRFPDNQTEIIIDPFPDCGAISGLYAALDNTCYDWVFVIANDMPLAEKNLINFLCSFVNEEYDAIIPVTRDGRLHPLCALYHKRTLPLVKQQIEAGNYRVMDAIKLMKVKEVYLRETEYADEVLMNINTPEDYKRLKELT